MPDAITESQRLLAQLRFPCGEVPEPGDIKNVAPGIYWLRMPLPFQHNHITLWMIEEKAGWTIVDTGINSQDTRGLWEKIFAEKLGGKPVTRVICTHMHPDHIGLAGWMTRKFDCRLWMTRLEYLQCRMLVADTGREGQVDSGAAEHGRLHDVVDVQVGPCGPAPALVVRAGDEDEAVGARRRDRHTQVRNQRSGPDCGRYQGSCHCNSRSNRHYQGGLE